MIGIFDSGVGGLSVFREIRKSLPKEDYIYYSDNAHCPYGEKSKEYIIDRARKITEFFMARGARAIVIACNTATSAAIATLRNEYSIPFIGMEPAIKPATKLTKTKVVGVLATAGTLKGEKYHNTRDEFACGTKVVEHIGEGFVELVERGIFEGKEAEDCIKISTLPLIEAGADVIVLGCTHYSFLKDTIQKIVGDNIKIIDPAPAVARQLIEVMSSNDLLEKDAEPQKKFSIELFSSGDDTALKRAAYLHQF